MPLENAQIVAPVAGLRRGCPAPNGTISSTHTGPTPFHTTGSSFSDLGDPYESAPSSPARPPAVLVPVGTPTSLRALLSLAYLPLNPCAESAPLRTHTDSSPYSAAGHINSIGTLCKIIKIEQEQKDKGLSGAAGP
ncbi:hypothetical protein H4582DRAFT_2063631 [Lactarius indigo]|nr:hypothetical protein H4582DRAFT_2063631 [Lactarius indigo]